MMGIASVELVYITRSPNKNNMDDQETADIDLSKFKETIANLRHQLSQVSRLIDPNSKLFSDTINEQKNLQMGFEKLEKDCRRVINQRNQLNKLVHTTALFTSKLDLNAVLDEVLDTVIHLTGAERVYLMLFNDEDALEIKAARNWDQETLAKMQVGLSNSVIKTALKDRKPVITLNAQYDDRFSSRKSVIIQKLRSIICIPLTLGHKTVGVLYADNRHRVDVFSKDFVPILTAFGVQAAIAITNAKLYGWMQASEAALTQSNLELQAIRLSLEDNVQQRITELWETNLQLQQEITERKRIEEQLYYLATHDTLTGLPNRSAFFDRLGEAVVRAKRNKTKLAVFFIDLDGFKAINDQHGHDRGDYVLKRIAQRLTNTLRESDIVARFGGDEFTFLFEDILDQDAVVEALERLLSSISKDLYVNDQPVTITASAGISIYPDDGEDSNTLLKKADDAMYVAKKEGKNRFYFFSETGAT